MRGVLGEHVSGWSGWWRDEEDGSVVARVKERTGTCKNSIRGLQWE